MANKLEIKRMLPSVNTADDSIVVYKSSDGVVQLDVQLADETVWLSLNQLAVLFDRDKSVISRHISNIYREGELMREATVAKNATVHYLCFMINRIPVEQREKPSFYRDYDGIIYQYRKYAPWVAAISRQYCETFGITNS